MREILEVSQSTEITFDSLLDMTDYSVKKLQHMLYAAVVVDKSVKIIEHLKNTDYPSYLIVACAGKKRESAWMCMPRDEHNWIENREFRTIINMHPHHQPLAGTQRRIGHQMSLRHGECGTRGYLWGDALPSIQLPD